MKLVKRILRFERSAGIYASIPPKIPPAQQARNAKNADAGSE